MSQIKGVAGWTAVEATKADAVKTAQAFLDDYAGDKDDIDAVWVVKSPHFIACE